MGSPRTYQIGLIPGDGIGPELVDSAVAVLEAAAGGSVELRTVTEDAGADTHRRCGTAMSADTLARITTDYDGVLKGPVGLPDVRHPDGTEAGVLGGILRRGLDAYANVRPVRLLPGASSSRAEPIDYVLVRENTEGLYLSRGLGVGTDHAVSDQLMVTRPGVERIARFAFETARGRSGAPRDGVRRVTCVDKSNVLRSYAFFRRVFDEVAADYPDVECDHRYADAAGHDLVTAPGGFDVLVMENFLGDLLSDVGAATVGGLGMCPSGNIGEGVAYFEPVHGSAPSLAGTGRANPTGQILAAAHLLDHLGEPEVAGRVRKAVERAFAEGAIRVLDSGVVEGGLDAATRAVVDRLDAP